MRIGVFGGSFDPIHHGHLIAAVALRELLELDEVRFVVAKTQPLKTVGHFAGAEDRATMVELGTRGAHGLRVDRRELFRDGPSFTVETLQEIREAVPGAELVLLLGADAAAEFERWREPETIRALARVEVFRRDGRGDGIVVPRVDISSTEVRARVSAGRSIRFWVPDAVADYIVKHRLYEASKPV